METAMGAVEQAIQTQLSNIQKKTGKTLEQLTKAALASGFKKHGEIRDYLKKEFSLGHGDANTLAHVTIAPEKYLPKSEDAPSVATADDPLDAIYTGPKAWMRPIHEAVMKAILKFGEFEISPKKGYVSLRRKKQFAMIGPATNTRFEVGINIKELPENPRIDPQPPKSMCQYKLKITQLSEVDKELISWIQLAFNEAG
jgi:hypothetical protein